MNSSLETLMRLYEEKSFTEEAKRIFYEMQDNSTQEFFDLIKLFITENKIDEFTLMSLKSLDFCRGIINKVNLNDIKNVLKNVIEQDYSLASKKEAAVQLGYFGEWPDLVLKDILLKPFDRELKVFAFRLILTQLKLPQEVIELETELAINGEVEPSLGRVELVTQARADGHFDHLSAS